AALWRYAARMAGARAPLARILWLCLVLVAGTYRPAAARCGDSIPDPGEQCDDGPFNGMLSLSCCTIDCQFVTANTQCGCPCGDMICPGASSECVICGDVDHTQGVNIGDALIVAQYDVGFRQCGGGTFVDPAVCDVNEDGGCDIGDALRMAQCDVGLIN